MEIEQVMKLLVNGSATCIDMSIENKKWDKYVKNYFWCT